MDELFIYSLVRNRRKFNASDGDLRAWLSLFGGANEVLPDPDLT